MMVLLIALFALPAKAANGPADLYLVYFKDSAWQYAQFDQSTTDVYTCTHSFSAGEKFYIANAQITLNPTDSNGKPTTKNSTYECSNYNVTSGYNQQVWQYGDSQSAYTCTNAGVYTLTVNFTDIGNIKFQFNSAASTSTYTYSIQGNIDGSNWGSNAMTENNGVWEWTATVKAGSFGIQKLDKDGKQVNWIWSADKAPISAAGEYNAVIQNGGNGADWSSTLAGEYTFSFDPSTMKLTVSGGSTPTVDKYYVKYTTDSWNPFNSYEMTYNEGSGTYTYTLTDPKTSWELAMQDKNQDDFWTDSDDNKYTGGTKSFTMEGTSSKNILFGEGLSGEYTLTYDPDVKTLTISGGSTPTPSVSYRLKTSENNWSTFIPLTDNVDGTYGYTFTNPVEGLQFMVQRSTDNGQSYFDFCWPDANDKDYIGGEKTFTMSGAFGNNVTFGAGLKGDYTLTFTPNTTDPKQSTLKIKGTAVATFDNIYLRGSNPLSWSDNKDEYKFSPTADGKIYTLTGVNLDKNVEMKAYNSTKDTWYGYDNSNVAGPTSNSNNNIKLNEKIDDATIILDLSGDKPEITILKPVYLRGDFTTTAWTDDRAYKFSTTDGKIYTLTGVNIANGKKMKVYYGGNPYGYDKDKVSTPLKDDGTNDHNMQLYADLIDATMTFDITDATNWKFIVDNNKDAYLRGDFTATAWEKDEAYKFSTTDNKTYVLEHVNLEAGKLLKVYYGGLYYGHDAGKVTGPVELENKTNYNMKLTEALKDATITFTMPSPYSADWTVSIVNGAKVEHKPYYFVGDMNRWYSKEFEGDESKKGIDPDIFAAEKDKWKFEYVGEVAGQPEKGWYKYVFDEKKVGMSTLVGQFQIIDRGDWNNGAEVYSHNPKVTDYNDASGFARYINNPITSEMIIDGTPLTKDGTPGIVKANGSNFHLDCNGVNHAVIYFLPGDNPKMIVKGDPTDYFVFYSADGKSGGNNAVSMQIVNDKPNVNNYYLPGVKNLKNYTKADASAEGSHMNIAPVDLTMIDFSAEKFEQSDAFKNVFGASENVGNLTLGDFVKMIKDQKKLPNGISLDGKEQVYVIKIPNGFEYAAGTKFAVKFDKAFAASEIGSTSTIVANHLYFFNDKLHVMLNVDNYEKEAVDENAFVNLYYRVYGYDGAYNTVVVNSDGSTTKLYDKGAVIGNTAEAIDETQKNAGWVAYNHYGEMRSILSGALTGNWHYATDDAGNIYGLDPKFGNFFVQFKIVTGPDGVPESANGPAKVVDQEYTLYLPEKTLALNQEGFYNFNGKDLYVALEGGYTTTDVEDVFEDQIVEEGVDAEPIFFNLQGQRVVNPEKGMYIVVKGNKTYKVMIK